MDPPRTTPDSDAESETLEPVFHDRPGPLRTAVMLIVVFSLVFALTTVAARGLDPRAGLIVAAGSTLLLGVNLAIYRRRRDR